MNRLNRPYFDQNISIDNALSMNQILHQLKKTIDEIVDTINNFETDSHTYTDTKVAEVRAELLETLRVEVEGLNADIDQLREYVDTRDNAILSNSKAYTDSEINEFKTDYVDVKIAEIYARITSVKELLDNKIDFVDSKLVNLVEETRAELIELIKGGGVIYSGQTGLPLSVQSEISKNVYDVYSRFFGLTWYTFEKFFLNYSVLYKFNPTELYETTQSNEKNAFIYWDNATLNGYVKSFSVYQENEGYPVIITITFSSNITNLVNADNVLLNGETITNLSVTNNSIVFNVQDKSLIDNAINYIAIRNGTTDIVSNMELSLVQPTNKILMTWDSVELLNTSTYSENGITWDLITYYFYSLWDIYVNKIVHSTQCRNFINTFYGATFDYQKLANHLNEWNAMANGRNILTEIVNSKYLSITVKGSVN